MKEITVLMVEPGKHPVVATLENSLDALQKAVSIGADYQGLIELVDIERGVCVLCNEVGKLIGLEGNRRIGTDVIAGVFYVLGENGRGDLCSLSKQFSLTEPVAKTTLWGYNIHMSRHISASMMETVERRFRRGT